MNIYIDIDGVFLTRDLKIPEYAIELLQYLNHNFQCYWLTTHCRCGENKTIQYLSQFYSKEELKHFESINPTNWDCKKTEAIDFNKPFIWLEDNPFEAEKLDLKKYNSMASLFVVDLKNKGELQNTLKKIKNFG